MAIIARGVVLILVDNGWEHHSVEPNVVRKVVELREQILWDGIVRAVCEKANGKSDERAEKRGVLSRTAHRKECRVISEILVASLPISYSSKQEPRSRL